MQRVMIVGGSGSGKSTLARLLSQYTGLPVHHMDQIQWMPGWVSRSRSERIELSHAVERGDAWIFEGNFTSTFDNRAARADTLIWLDLPVGLRLWRVTWRLVRYYGQERPDMAVGCTEGLHSETWPFYRWIWDTRQTHRVRFKTLIAGHPHLKVHHLTSRSDVTQFMQRMSGAA